MSFYYLVLSLLFTPGAILRENAENDTKQQTSTLAQSIQNQTPPERIGHRAGGYQDYPKNLNQYTFDYAPISDLMDRSFEEFKLTGIELDLRYSREHGIVITHDLLQYPLSEAARTYLEENSLENVLSYFRNHYENKKIYFEIKVQSRTEILTEDDKIYLDAVIDFFKNQSPNQLAFVSFYPRAIEYLQHDLPDFEYGQIITSNKLILRPIINRMNLPFFDKNALKRLRNNPKTTFVWLDIQYFYRLKHLFREVNMGRQELKVGVAAYTLPFKKLLRLFRKLRPFNAKFQSVIFDIKS